MAIDDHARPLSAHGYPSRPDLTHSVSVVLPAPGFLYPRDFRDEAGNVRMPPDDTRERFRPFLREYVDLAIGAAPPALRPSVASAEPRPYAFGPPGRAGAYEAVHYVLTALPTVQEIADAAVTWVEIGTWAVGMKRGVRALVERWRREGKHPTVRDLPAWPAPVIRALCLTHAVSTYPEAQHGDVTVHGRHFGGGSPDLPNGEELYNVAVTGKGRAFVYVLDGRARPRDHFAVGPGGLTPLDLPDLDDYVFDPPSGTGEYMVLPPMRIGRG